MNRLVVVGWLGIKTCYLNISREEAIRRWQADNPSDEPFEERGVAVREFEFADEFGAYDAWSIEEAST